MRQEERPRASGQGFRLRSQHKTSRCLRGIRVGLNLALDVIGIDNGDVVLVNPVNNVIQKPGNVLSLSGIVHIGAETHHILILRIELAERVDDDDRGDISPDRFLMIV